VRWRFLIKGFKERGLEIHSPRMWDFAQVLNALDFIEQYNLTSLIFHENELLDRVVFPEKYFSMEYMWERFGPRYSRTLNKRYYINNVIDECHKRGIKFIAEVKELYFDEWIIELHPEVINPKTGRLCPSHPFWWEYLEAKMDEFLKYIPDIDGVIVSPGTRESKLSIVANKCGCDACNNSDDAKWVGTLLKIMYDKLQAKGKFLVVRDFSFTADDQTIILQGANMASEDIIIALKYTPHDYFPTFPTNPAIGQSKHEEWIEFDVWGQFIGNGVFPISIVEDFKDRMQQIYDLGAKGIWLRTDWENMDDHCVFNSPNMVNLIGGAMLAKDIDTDIDEIYKEWARFGMLSPLKAASHIQKPVPIANLENYTKLRDFMRASWKVMEKTVFARGLLFQDNSMFPHTMERCFAIMLDLMSLDYWDPTSSKKVEPTIENIEIIFEEKRQAVEESKKLAEILDVDSLGLPEDMAFDLKDLLDIYTYYTKCFYLSAQACFWCRRAEITKDKNDRDRAVEVLEEIKDFIPALKERITRRTYTHEIRRLIDYKRFETLIENITDHLNKVEYKASS
jgi:hypothetical protein